MFKSLTLIFLFFNLTLIASNQGKSPKDITVFKGGFVKLPSECFYDTANGNKQKNTKYKTEVWLEYLENSLKFTFICNNNSNVKKSNIHINNIGQEEIFGILIAPQNTDTSTLFDFQINPSNTVYAARTTKSDIKKKEKKLNLIMVRHEITQRSKTSWNGWITIPFSIINKSVRYKLNLFRTIPKTPTYNKKDNLFLLSYCPKFSKLIPQFNEPEYSIDLTILPRENKE